jgi:hypothetical protein
MRIVAVDGVAAAWEINGGAHRDLLAGMVVQRLAEWLVDDGSVKKLEEQPDTFRSCARRAATLGLGRVEAAVRGKQDRPGGGQANRGGLATSAQCDQARAVPLDARGDQERFANGDLAVGSSIQEFLQSLCALSHRSPQGP